MASVLPSLLPKVEQLSSRVVRVMGLNPGRYTLQGTNTYLVGSGERRILIDTGEHNRPDYVELLKSTLANLSATVHTILITHWHHDHIGGLEAVYSLFPEPPLVCKLQRPAPERDSLEDKPTLRQCYLEDGQQVETEGATLRVLHTPGHTTDHMALWLEEEKAVFTGDCILGMGSAVFEDMHSYMHSLSNLLTLCPSVLYPGHGPMISNGVEKIEEYISHRMEREKQILAELARVGQPITAMDIVKEVYKDVDQALWKGAEGNVLHHLKKLFVDGAVAKSEHDADCLRWSLKATQKL